jgi:hypothetical protein
MDPEIGMMTQNLELELLPEHMEIDASIPFITRSHNSRSGSSLSFFSFSFRGFLMPINPYRVVHKIAPLHETAIQEVTLPT